MSEGMIIRDPDEMEKFASEVETYCAEMKAACNIGGILKRLWVFMLCMATTM